MSSSYPSGAAFLTASMAMKPLAPGRDSTMTCWPQTLESLSPSTCMKTDGPELLEKGDTILTTFDGYAGLAEGDSAGEAVAAPSQAAAKTTSLGRVFLFIVASFRALPGGSRSLRKDSTNSGPQTIGAGTKLGARPRDRAAFATAWCRRKACSS